MKVDLTSIYSKYKGKWVALDTTLKKVIASNKKASEAYKEAVNKGYGKPTLFKVPQENVAYFGFNPHEA